MQPIEYKVKDYGGWPNTFLLTPDEERENTFKISIGDRDLRMLYSEADGVHHICLRTGEIIIMRGRKAWAFKKLIDYIDKVIIGVMSHRQYISKKDKTYDKYNI